ncbi:hypothetical protein FQZ97_750700 [compost metagenome]
MTVRTINGMESSMAIVMKSSTVNRTPKTSSEKRRAPSMPFFSISLANSGTKAALNAPSANNLRNVFGKRKAALNASATGPVPSAAAMNISRVKPKMRLISVPDATVANFLTKLIELKYLYYAAARPLVLAVFSTPRTARSLRLILPCRVAFEILCPTRSVT